MRHQKSVGIEVEPLYCTAYAPLPHGTSGLSRFRFGQSVPTPSLCGMWYYESLANQWPAPPWATDSQRFVGMAKPSRTVKSKSGTEIFFCMGSRLIMVQCRNCTIIKYKRRTAANQWPKAALATDWPTIHSTTLLTADPESVARKSAFCRPARGQVAP